MRLPNYKLFVEIIWTSKEKLGKFVKLVYVNHEDKLVYQPVYYHNTSVILPNKYYEIEQKGNIQHVNDIIIKGKTVYFAYDSTLILDYILYPDQLTDVIGNAIFIFDDGKYYYMEYDGLNELSHFTI
jgi:hypothetical protein